MDEQLDEQVKRVVLIANTTQLYEGQRYGSNKVMRVLESDVEDLVATRFARRPKPLELKRLKAEGAVSDDELRTEGSRNRYLRRDLRVKD